MKFKSLLIATAILHSSCAFAANKTDQADIWSTSACSQNCIAVTQVGSSLSILWRGIDGNPVKALSVQLPKDAVLLSTAKAISDSSISAASLTGGGTSTTTTTTYTTTTEIVVVVIACIYDAEGNLISVQTSTFRTPYKNQEK